MRIRLRLTPCASTGLTPGILNFSMLVEIVVLTESRQFFHADDSDIVGLLCIARALEGGESDIVSSHHVYNTLAKERPDVLKTLTEPIWYFDRKGETSKGQEEYIRTSVMYLERGENPRVYTKYAFPFSLSRYKLC